MTWDPAAVRALFPVTRRYAYFNAAANAPIADPVRDAVAGYFDDLAAHGSLHYRGWFQETRDVRERAARLLGADPEEVALVRNTSEGMNVVANGLGLGAGDSIVVVSGDFPANVLPWRRLEADGVEVRFVEPDAENRVTPERVAAACDASTRIASVSWVSFTNGFRLDVAALATLLHARDVLLFVDAIQGLGVLPLDVRAADLDFVSADGHKWMLTPEGIGVFFVRRSLLERIRPTFVSWLSVTDPFEHARYDSPLHPDARRFEFATPNTAGIFALRAGLDVLLEAGVENVARHVKGLTDALCAGLAARGYRVRSPRGDGEWSGIVGFDAGGDDLGPIHAALEAASVQTARRGDVIRAAVHLYNDAGDVERLLGALPARAG
ncbi:MAG: aminotransferase class V-fold PLP-dependent enzyme [Planctomycetota bacterium JB042]